MRLLFKQRFFSWLDSYEIYDEAGNTVYSVRGELAWGHQLRIYDANGFEVGLVKERIFTFLPKFEMYLGDRYVGSICRELSLFVPRYNIECNGWQVEGSIFEWDYTVLTTSGARVADISKQLFNFTDTYILDVYNPCDALCVLMLVLAIDAEKCSRDNG